MIRRWIAFGVAALCFGTLSCSNNSQGSQSGQLEGVGRLPGYDFWAPVTLPDGVALAASTNGTSLGQRQGECHAIRQRDRRPEVVPGQATNTLEPLGWQIAVEAEPGRFAEFGVRVLQSRIDAIWDVVVIYLGTNYEGNESSLRAQFEQMFETTRGVETVVLTTGVFRDAQKTVNKVIKEVAGEFDHVNVLDWASVAKVKGINSADNIHLSDLGRAALAQTIGRALDYAPYREASCLDPRFRDDSAINRQPVETTLP